MDYSKYVGIPYVKGGRDIGNPQNGLDCWGLATLFYKNEYGVILPSYTDISMTTDRIKEVSGQLVQTDCYKHFNTVQKSKAGDLILLRVGGHPIHIGIVLDNKLMLHANTGSSVIETYKGMKWQQRIHSFLRYVPKV
jgi:cell wall-associated NlpC family hydrolase